MHLLSGYLPLASDPEEICDLFAEFIQRTYTDDVWVPNDTGPEHVLDEPPFGAVQFTSDEVERFAGFFEKPAFEKPLSLIFLFNKSMATSVFLDR
jgi:hypothetical protein